MGHGAVPLSMTLAYEPDDPYAVHLTFWPGLEPTTWIFARDLLVEGMDRWAGIGDVRIWPLKFLTYPAIAVAVSSHDGDALFELPAIPVRLFLAEVAKEVPPGTESSHVDIDGLIKLLCEDKQ